MASIEKRGKNSFRLVVEAGYGANNKRIKKSKTIRIEDESLLRTTKKIRDYLNEELVKFKIEVEAGEYIAPEKMLFESFVREWKEKYATKHLEPTTINTYERHLKNHIIPEFGHMKLNQIKPMHILTFLDKLAQPGMRKDNKKVGLSGTSRRYIHIE
ncbi:N-terminal phage integrase SAM-like domain-containing protein [Chengkuizengella sediminis]|uniref:N-terminal phage integrase SAM-like domain-containing protein n=1 Tax=Chengkuizengella sediminis TaxID=1885917 RepID=UPI001F0E4E44|nr:N-terminal phage integrase SAM-like domain-containing protein [Chengkuizengella sediminis]